MNDYISRKAVMSKCDDIWNAADETTQTGVDTINTIDKITDFIESLPAADVQPVISSDNCIVCGRDVRKDSVYYDLNGGTICESCMNTKCKCKNGRDTEGKVTERNIEVSRPDGNCLDCKFQYYENSDYWCSICPGNPEDI